MRLTRKIFEIARREPAAMASKYADSKINSTPNMIPHDEWINTVIRPSIANLNGSEEIVGVDAMGGPHTYRVRESCLIVEIKRLKNGEIYANPVGVTGILATLELQDGARHVEIAKLKAAGKSCTVIPLGSMQFHPAPNTVPNTCGQALLLHFGAKYVTLGEHPETFNSYDVVQMYMGGIAGLILNLTTVGTVQEQADCCQVIVYMVRALQMYFRNYQEECARVEPIIHDDNPRDILHKIILYIFFEKKMLRINLMKTIYTTFARLTKRGGSAAADETVLLSKHRGPMATLLVSFVLARMMNAGASVDDMRDELERECSALFKAMIETAAGGPGGMVVPFAPIAMNRAIATQLFTAAQIPMTWAQIDALLIHSLDPRNDNVPSNDLMIQLGLCEGAELPVNVDLNVKASSPAECSATADGRGVEVIGKQPRMWAGFAVEEGEYILTAERIGRGDVILRFTCGYEILPKDCGGYSAAGIVATFDKEKNVVNFTKPDPNLAMIGFENGEPIRLVVNTNEYSVYYQGSRKYYSERNFKKGPIVIGFKGCKVTIKHAFANQQRVQAAEEKAEHAEGPEDGGPLAEPAKPAAKLTKKQMAEIPAARLIELLSEQAGGAKAKRT